jgi:hypothetical protein
VSAGLLVPVAHHSLLVALPFFAPVLLLTAAVLLFAIRERRRRDREQATG